MLCACQYAPAPPISAQTTTTHQRRRIAAKLSLERDAASVTRSPQGRTRRYRPTGLCVAFHADKSKKSSLCSSPFGSSSPQAPSYGRLTRPGAIIRLRPRFREIRARNPPHKASPHSRLVARTRFSFRCGQPSPVDARGYRDETGDILAPHLARVGSTVLDCAGHALDDFRSAAPARSIFPITPGICPPPGPAAGLGLVPRPRQLR